MASVGWMQGCRKAMSFFVYVCVYASVEEGLHCCVFNEGGHCVHFNVFALQMQCDKVIKTSDCASHILKVSLFGRSCLSWP